MNLYHNEHEKPWEGINELYHQKKKITTMGAVQDYSDNKNVIKETSQIPKILMHITHLWDRD